MASPSVEAAREPGVGSEPEPFTMHVGTRRSALALKQVELVTASLKQANPHISFEVHTITPMGDRDKTTPLPALGKGLWTTELEAQLLAGDVDMVVHCLKDMPTSLPDGCIIGCVPARQDPRDVVIFKDPVKYSTISDLPAGSVIGTSSVRRAAQLRRRYPGLIFRDVRGNIDTRLRKLDAEDGPFDCIILAAAGMLRMNMEARIAQYLSSETEGGGLLHAVGQGALAIEVREGDECVVKVLSSIADEATTMACLAERSVMRTLEGGCSVPVGVETEWEKDGEGQKLRLRATVVSLDGQDAVDADRVQRVTTAEEADAFGRAVAKELAEKGGQMILDTINKGRPEQLGPGAVKLAETSR